VEKKTLMDNAENKKSITFAERSCFNSPLRLLVNVENNKKQYNVWKSKKLKKPISKDRSPLRC
jgi:hypothetical protein